MCGGLARWLRLLGVDTSYVSGVDDAALLRNAEVEDRIVISSDGPLFERRALAEGRVRGLRLPVGLRLEDQIRWVAPRLGIKPGTPRCTRCNGVLDAVLRSDVADRVPARSLIWLDDFYVCRHCDQVFWRGTHWQRIDALVESLSTNAGAAESAHGASST